MAARATRSASRKAQRCEEAVATGPLGALSHDELGVIVDGLADPLQPVVAVALGSTCLGLRTPLRAALVVLMERHARAKALSRKLGLSCEELRDAQCLHASGNLVADDMATLGMILSKWLPRLKRHHLVQNRFGDGGMHELCEGLGQGAAPSLRVLGLNNNKLGPLGAEALAAALRRGAMPQLDSLLIESNPFGNQGVAALAPALRKLPELAMLLLSGCEIGDEGVTSLFANLGKHDFKKLEYLDLSRNDDLTDKSCACLVAALDSGALPRLCKIYFVHVAKISGQARNAMYDALERAVERRAS